MSKEKDRRPCRGDGYTTQKETQMPCTKNDTKVDSTDNAYCTSGTSPTAEELAALPVAEAKRRWHAHLIMRDVVRRAAKSPAVIYVAAVVLLELALVMS